LPCAIQRRAGGVTLGDSAVKLSLGNNASGIQVCGAVVFGFGVVEICLRLSDGGLVF
jgi:hypothetical protein